MKIPRLLCAMLILLGLATTHAQANWMTFFGSGVTSTGVWPGGSQLSGTATATASSFINGIPSTPFIGLAPNSVGSLSADYAATGLQPNPGPVVDLISTPYNDTGDKYHVVIDFSGTTGGSNPGVLPAGSIFALIDLDSTENYRQITATNAANAVITTPWINGPNGYFDMNNPLTPVAFMTPPPTLTGPVAGVYQMFGPSANFDVGMWLFKTTQDVKTISFNMELGIQGGPFQGGGGAGWGFYTTIVPEPTAVALSCVGLIIGGCLSRRGRRC
jgi:hypothetical protein